MALACRVVDPKAQATPQRPTHGALQRKAKAPGTEHSTPFLIGTENLKIGVTDFICFLSVFAWLLHFES